MLAKLKEYVVVCLHNKAPLTGLNLKLLQDKILASRPHYWEETEPGVFLSFYLIKRGGRTRSLKLSAGAGSLRKTGTVFENLGVAKTVGELITETNWYGKIITCPFGDAVNKALKRASEDAERDSIRPTTEGEADS